MYRALLPLLALLSLFASACMTSSLAAKKPEGKTLNRAMTQMWTRDVKRVARSGDWILSRSYSTVGDAIVTATSGEDFSHAVIYDAQRNTVIEAIRPSVHEVPLEQFLDRNRYVVVIRPENQTAAQGRLALQRARSALGASFDYTGMLGIDNSSRFYCSELVAWASQVAESSTVITPAELWDLGQLLYLSGDRNEGQVQSAALALQNAPSS